MVSKGVIPSSRDSMALMGNALVDIRLSAAAFKLYCAIIYVWTLRKRPRCIAVKRLNLMNASLIRSTTTYHKAIQNLSRANYIRYFPTFHPTKYSEIEIVLIPDHGEQL